MQILLNLSFLLGRIKKQLLFYGSIEPKSKELYFNSGLSKP